jgi:uncharacterized protein
VSWQQLAVLWCSGFCAGAVNALAGGGTLITFPAMVAMGLPSLVANVSNTIALCPGFLGAVISQRRELATQRRRILLLAPLAAAGGGAGAYILRHTSPGAFTTAAPILVLASVALLAAGPAVKRSAARRSARNTTKPSTADGTQPDRLAVASLAIIAVAVYGGYFGAGMSVMIIAVLSIVLTDSLLNITALKQLLALIINGAAAIYLLIVEANGGLIYWPAVAAVGTAAVVGGATGARIGQRIPESVLRAVVVTIGVAFALLYWLK